ncbi:MAG: transporter substrate-binding domain-containing protein [Hyphomicrobiales bacterium]
MWNSIKPVTGLAAAVLAAAMFATTLGSPAIAGDLELLVPGELSAATEGTFPPFNMQGPDGKLDGLEMRVMGEIAKRLGLTYKPVITKWETILIGLKADQYDTSSDAMDITEERQKQVVFVDGWLESGGRLVVKNDSALKSNADIKGKTVGVLVASTWEKLATNLGASVKTYKSETDAIQDLVNGNVDGVITDSIAAAYVIKTSKLPLRLMDGYLSSIQKGFPVKPGKPNLVKAMNKALADMIADGTYAKLTTDLIGYSPAPAKPIRSIL